YFLRSVLQLELSIVMIPFELVSANSILLQNRGYGYFFIISTSFYNAPLFIVSNCQTDYLNAFFTAHQLKEYFTDYECSGNTGLPKSENIKLIVKRNNLKKAFYVGDTELDGESAHVAGIPFVLADYGFGKCKEYEYIIETFSDLLRIF
ncbi:MAG: HAD family hydrolase, partial [Ruminococcus sp.]|nr:HAD family hydrolase [Ruminococcus sp.]